MVPVGTESIYRETQLVCGHRTLELYTIYSKTMAKNVAAVIN